MVGGLVLPIVLTSERQNRVEQRGIVARHYPQGLDITGASCLEVYHAARGMRDQRVYRELVGAGMQAELVGTQRTGDLRVPVQILGQRVGIADVVNALLEAPHVAGRQADPP